MAFVSSFHGNTALGHRSFLTQKTSSRPTMKFGSDKMLEKYDKMSRETPTSQASSKPSSVWSSYSQSVFEKFAPTRSQIFAPKGSYESMMNALTLQSRNFRTPGGSPLVTAADTYMADCVTRQYKALSCANGIYGVQCTEGTYRGAAEGSRVLALATRFRQGQLSTSAKFADLYSVRKRAAMATHGCSYEEALVAAYPQVASAMVTGLSEANGACIRYAAPTDPADKYMTACVDKQNKFRAVPMGVFGVMCQDGSVRGMAEFKRVQGLGANFRAGQLGPIVSEDRKFAVRKWARENYAQQCSYEEELFNNYVGVSKAMRYESVRY